MATHVANGSAATLLTSVVDDPTGYGRVLTGRDGQVVRIVEQRDASPDERAITEVATSIYVFRRDLLGPALRSITPDNAQGELYLTDVIGVLAGMGHRVGGAGTRRGDPGRERPLAVGGAERELRIGTNRHWLLNGVTMLEPSQTFIDVTVKLGRERHAVPGHDPGGEHGRR